MIQKCKQFVNSQNLKSATLFFLCSHRFFKKNNTLINYICNNNYVNSFSSSSSMVEGNHVSLSKDEANKEKNDESSFFSFSSFYSDCPSNLKEFFEENAEKNFIVPADPYNNSKLDVKRCVINSFVDNAFDVSTPVLESSWKNFSYPSPSTLWPNPLLHNHRLKSLYFFKKKKHEMQDECDKKSDTLENKEDICAQQGDLLDQRQEELIAQIHLNKNRIESLWKYSKSYGISWDELDNLYIHFVEMRNRREDLWNDNKTQIMTYIASKIKDKIINERKIFFDTKNVDLTEKDEATKETLLCPRSIFRKQTRKEYFRVRDKYLKGWRFGSLLKYFKGEMTLKMMQREINERKLMLDEHVENNDDVENSKQFSSNDNMEENNKKPKRTSTYWLYQKPHGSISEEEVETFLSKNESFNEWDLEGVGENMKERLIKRIKEKKLSEK